MSNEIIVDIATGKRYRKKSKERVYRTASGQEIPQTVPLIDPTIYDNKTPSVIRSFRGLSSNNRRNR